MRKNKEKLPVCVFVVRVNCMKNVKILDRILAVIVINIFIIFFVGSGGEDAILLEVVEGRNIFLFHRRFKRAIIVFLIQIDFFSFQIHILKKKKKYF